MVIVSTFRRWATIYLAIFTIFYKLTRNERVMFLADAGIGVPATVDVVDTRSTFKEVGVVATLDGVVAIATMDVVFATASVNAVVAVVTIDGVVTTATFSSNSCCQQLLAAASTSVHPTPEAGEAPTPPR